MNRPLLTLALGLPLALVILSGCTVAPQVTTDAQACGLMSDAIAAVNAENYGSVGDITADNNETSIISSNAAIGSGSGVYEGTGNAARSLDLKNALAAVFEGWKFGSELINFEVNPSGHSPGTVFYESNADLHQVVLICAKLGFPLQVAAYNFEVPAPADVPTEQPIAPASPPATIAIPVDFIDGGEGVAYKQIEGDCGNLRCAHYALFAYENCPTSAYLEANELDANGVIYGYTNAAIGTMVAGDTAIATLNALNDQATKLRVTKVNCY